MRAGGLATRAHARRRDESRQELNVNGQVTMVIQDRVTASLPLTMAFSPRHSIDEVRRSKSGNRHQLKRSITELASPVKLSRQQRKDRDRHNDDRPPHAVSANPLLWSRTSVDMPRSEGVTPIISPDQSRRPSIMLQREEENRTSNPLPPPPEPKVNKEERLREEREKTSSQVE
ncbi:hypothetical protein AUP68_12979 [Ilyonectria robusta]